MSANIIVSIYDENYYSFEMETTPLGAIYERVAVGHKSTLAIRSKEEAHSEMPG
jgi:hypothetical protein